MYFICSGDCAHFDAGAFNLDTVCTFSGASIRLTGAERAHANTHTHTVCISMYRSHSDDLFKYISEKCPKHKKADYWT